MSAVALQAPRPKPGSPDDPFRFGYREIIHTLPDGTTEVERIGLTLEDVLHPQMGDVIMESSLHDLIRAYLAGVFRARTANNPQALVLSNTGIYWDKEELDHHSPDDAVIFGVRRQKREWTSFYVAKEGVRPKLIVEIVSISTRKNDVETKFEQYHQAGVTYYIIVDREQEDGPWQLLGYQWAARKYLPMPKDERGRLWLDDLGVWLGIKGDKVVCYDGETDEEIGDYTEVSERLKQETARAQAAEAGLAAEVEARRAAEQRVRDLEAELARVRSPQP